MFKAGQLIGIRKGHYDKLGSVDNSNKNVAIINPERPVREGTVVMFLWSRSKNFSSMAARKYLKFRLFVLHKGRVFATTWNDAESHHANWKVENV